MQLIVEVAHIVTVRIGLAIYLCGLLYEATRDLYRLNPDDAPSPTEMFTRFVAWGPHRRPIVAPPGGW
ncbi:hypothetical protein [Micromonospora sediminicola]|uniref:hypothetical protein n=1 Tax=Micromonospora sediminicola TaxID=946078 RepID=UPI000AEA8389|nr:hypothetical protein [Micromonospora sediminicola]